MEKRELSWQLGYTKEPDREPESWMPAKVPGSVQQDYARAQGWEPFYIGTNTEDYGWMEDMYWLYRAPVRFDLAQGQRADLIFTAIDYHCTIRIDGRELYRGEGMFTPMRLDVTEFAGQDAVLEVLIWPAPKDDGSGTRSQARRSAKAAACYGWDWHPRLVTAGIWDEAYLLIRDCRCVTDWELSYTLTEALDLARIRVGMQTAADCPVRVRLWDGEAVAAEQTVRGRQETVLELKEPKLWYPVGLGEQHRYRVTLETLDEKGQVLECESRHLGLRRAKLVMNTGGWAVPGYPKTRAHAPATLEVNGIRVFAKGSNWVNEQVFPADMNEDSYREDLTLARDANMNILRIWGGGFVNKESFYDLCDRLGLMVWQEFPLACNEYPDDPAYLSVLEKEAVGIVRRLRSHPCVVLWCGGNELFNSWSGMTEQHHALRLLDSVCYREDRDTPFIMTSPLNGMAHGNYINVDHKTGEEFITTLRRCRNTAYSEFGSSSISSRQTLERFMTQEEIDDCQPENPVWRSHFGFGAGGWEDRWTCKGDVQYYFGGWKDLDDLIEKSQFIQAMCYRAEFEEARRQWPLCSMALNWCFNEPWPTAANCNLVQWPALPKQAYYGVQQALRPQMASLAVDKHLWHAGEVFRAEVWLHNEGLQSWDAGSVQVYYDFGGGEILWGTLTPQPLAPQSNSCCAALAVPIPADFSGMLRIRLETDRQDAASQYRFPCRIKTGPNTAGMLNVD